MFSHSVLNSQHTVFKVTIWFQEAVCSQLILYQKSYFMPCSFFQDMCADICGPFNRSEKNFKFDSFECLFVFDCNLILFVIPIFFVERFR